MNLYVVESITLGARWLVQARDVEDAVGKLMFDQREWISSLEAACAKSGNDFDMDLRVNLHEGNVARL